MKAQPTIVLIDGEYLPRDLPSLLMRLGATVRTTRPTELGRILTQLPVNLVACGDPSDMPELKHALDERRPGVPLFLIADWNLRRASRTMDSGLVDDIIPVSLLPEDIATRLHSLAARHARGIPLRSTLPPGGTMSEPAPPPSPFPKNLSPPGPSLSAPPVRATSPDPVSLHHPAGAAAASSPSSVPPPPSQLSGVRRSPLPEQPSWQRSEPPAWPPGDGGSSAEDGQSDVWAHAPTETTDSSNRSASRTRRSIRTLSPPPFPQTGSSPPGAPRPVTFPPQSRVPSFASEAQSIPAQFPGAQFPEAQFPQARSPAHRSSEATRPNRSSLPPPLPQRETKDQPHRRLPREGSAGSAASSLPPPPPRRRPGTSSAPPVPVSGPPMVPPARVQASAPPPPPLRRRPSGARPYSSTTPPPAVLDGAAIPVTVEGPMLRSQFPWQAPSVPPVSELPATGAAVAPLHSLSPLVRAVPALGPSSMAMSGAFSGSTETPISESRPIRRAAISRAPMRDPGFAQLVSDQLASDQLAPVQLAPAQAAFAARAQAQPAYAHSGFGSRAVPQRPLSPITQSGVAPRQLRRRTRSSIGLAAMAFGGGAALGIGFFTARAWEQGHLQAQAATISQAASGWLERIVSAHESSAPSERPLSVAASGVSATRETAPSTTTEPDAGSRAAPSSADAGGPVSNPEQGSTTEQNTTPEVLALSDLKSSEADPYSGLTKPAERALFIVEDSKQPACSTILGGWTPELPLIEEERPERALRHKHLAQRYLMTGAEDGAQKELCKSVQLDPAGPGAEMLATLYLSQRSLDNAEQILRRLLQDRPDSETASELLGDVLNQQGDVPAARRVWLRLLDLDASDRGVLVEVGRRWVTHALTALKAKDVSRAERLLRRALTLDPNNASAAYLLAKVLDRQDEKELSRAWSERAREID